MAKLQFTGIGQQRPWAIVFKCDNKIAILIAAVNLCPPCKEQTCGDWSLLYKRQSWDKGDEA